MYLGIIVLAMHKNSTPSYYHIHKYGDIVVQDCVKWLNVAAQ
jgi:hypothetical protein